MSLRPRSNTLKEPAKAPQSSDSEEETALIEKKEEEHPPAAVASQSLPKQALSKAFASTGNLANLLPTGTLLAFQILTPVFSHNGSCPLATTRLLTQILLCALAASSFLASFTDSFKSRDGKVYYGFATFRGMWLFDFPANAPVPDLSKYRVRAVDFVHAALSVLLFVAVAMRDQNVVGCFYPQPAEEVREVLNTVPLGLGFVCSLLFVVFPTRRHGIGYPVTHEDS